MRSRPFVVAASLALVAAGQLAACAAPTGASAMTPPTASPSAEAGHQRFIVKYRQGSEPSQRVDDVQARLDATAADGVELRWQRRLGVQANLFTTSRPLDAAEAERLMQRFRADPDVEYIEPDSRMGIDPIRGPQVPVEDR